MASMQTPTRHAAPRTANPTAVPPSAAAQAAAQAAPLPHASDETSPPCHHGIAFFFFGHMFQAALICPGIAAGLLPNFNVKET